MSMEKYHKNMPPEVERKKRDKWVSLTSLQPTVAMLHNMPQEVERKVNSRFL